MEQAHESGRDGVVYVWPPLGGKVVTEYTIDFHAMQQANKSSGFNVE